MSDSSITQQPVDPQDWTVRDLRGEVQRLREQVARSGERIDVQVGQLGEWAAGLPANHQPVPDPVRLADLASTELERPLSLARRVIELARLLERADALAQTLMNAVVLETGIFAPDIPVADQSLVDQQVHPLETDEVLQPQVALIAHCASTWGDDPAFERQRQLVRQVMTFDGNRTWHGRLPASINDRLSDWQTVVEAAEAGAHVQIQPANS